MQRRWGIAWLAATIWLAGLVCVPGTALAADRDIWPAAAGGRLPFTAAAAQSPLESQMLGEKPFRVQPSGRTPDNLLRPTPSRLAPDRDGGTSLRLPYNLEMRISVLYSREAAPLEIQKRREASLLVKYAMEYRLLPNLQVGLNGYLYRPDEGLSLPRPLGDRLLGLGPGIKYDLGRWSFVMKSQLETGNRERSEGLQNWFRVWYAF